MMETDSFEFYINKKGFNLMIAFYHLKKLCMPLQLLHRRTFFTYLHLFLANIDCLNVDHVSMCARFKHL